MIEIDRGFPTTDRARAASLFWEAFEGKLGFSLGPRAKALRFLEDQMRSLFAFSAYEGDELLGLVGFKTHEGGLVGGEYRDLAQIYGYFGAAWRGAILSIFERDLAAGQLLLDGIFVSERARGRGIGTALLDAVEEFAIFEMYEEIRLDVIDTNPKARALYERRGFIATGTSKTGPLKPLLGFGSATTMVRRL